MEHSLCRPLVFMQTASNTQSIPLNSSKFVSAVPAMIYQPTWNQRDWEHEMEASDQIPQLWVVIMIKCPPSRAGEGVKRPRYAPGGGMLKKCDFTGEL